MRLLEIGDIQKIISSMGLERFNHQLIETLEQDFSRWQGFHLSARHATHYPHGVIELMPCSDDRLYSFKYVNGHPGNTAQGRLSVVAFGVLAEVSSGYPLLIAEMTLLTALRTAAVAALGARYLARASSRHLALIGCGAQGEFLVHALGCVLPLEQVSFFDPDGAAMRKFSTNLGPSGLQLRPCKGIDAALEQADVIVTATAAKRRQVLLHQGQVPAGTHIHALGGDCPGKTELDPALVADSKRVVEYLPQTREEGELQNLPEPGVHAELWELVSGNKPGREDPAEITLFDAVGFALEDFSILRLVQRLAQEMGLGRALQLIPELNDPKDLFGLIASPNSASSSSRTRSRVR